MNRVEWVKGSVTYGLGPDISLSHCLETGIWGLAHKSDHRTEISGSILWYDALVPRPEILHYWYFICACTVSIKLKCLPYSSHNVCTYHNADLRALIAFRVLSNFKKSNLKKYSNNNDNYNNSLSHQFCNQETPLARICVCTIAQGEFWCNELQLVFPIRS